MLYEVVKRIILKMCLEVGVPLSVPAISRNFGGVLDEELVELMCYYMTRDGTLQRFSEDTYTTRNMMLSCRLNLLVTEAYQELGMRLLQVSDSCCTRYIPAAVEHGFLLPGPSSIGKCAGFGLFVRTTRRIPQGCIFCEYRGRDLAGPSPRLEANVYVVRVRLTERYIDGVDANGEHLSLATFINDNGPGHANAEMMEYDRFPGRVFLVATRDLRPGEEIFALYGPTYWGFESYAQLQERILERNAQQEKGHRSREEAELKKDHSRLKRARADTPKDTDEAPRRRARDGYVAKPASKCRGCGEVVALGGAQLHARHCADPLSVKKLEQLDCMPRSEFTSLRTAFALLPSTRKRAIKRSTSLVDLSEPQTFAHTHEDVVRDLEFFFEETVSSWEPR